MHHMITHMCAPLLHKKALQELLYSTKHIIVQSISKHSPLRSMMSFIVGAARDTTPTSFEIASSEAYSFWNQLPENLGPKPDSANPAHQKQSSVDAIRFDPITGKGAEGSNAPSRIKITISMIAWLVQKVLPDNNPTLMPHPSDFKPYEENVKGARVVIKHYQGALAMKKVAARFAKRIQTAHQGFPLEKKPYLCLHAPAVYENMRSIFLVKGYNAGCAVTQDGELMSVFNGGLKPQKKYGEARSSPILDPSLKGPSLGRKLVFLAMAHAGVRKASCYGDTLVKLYSELGLKRVAYYPWERVALPIREKWPPEAGKPDANFLVRREQADAATALGHQLPYLVDGRADAIAIQEKIVGLKQRIV